jgi:hypothetical protein
MLYKNTSFWKWHLIVSFHEELWVATLTADKKIKWQSVMMVHVSDDTQ